MIWNTEEGFDILTKEKRYGTMNTVCSSLSFFLVDLHTKCYKYKEL